jgi:3-deoxy-D-manno-octulosonic-acid transferase
MYFLYSFLLAAWIFVMLPYFAYNGIKNKKYLPKLRERMGYLPPSVVSDGRPTIWFHSCSVGETLSVQPLAAALNEQFPNARLVFSVITQTGRKIADERFEKYGEGNAFYFPIDQPLFISKVLDQVKPSILICIDTEIWPNVIHMCRMRNIPVVLANGRISAESFKSYRWIQPLLGPVLSNYSALLMKSDEDADRIRRMGARASKIKITGNIKYDRGGAEKDVAAAQLKALDNAFKITSHATPVIVAGSTHEREEEILFDVLSDLRKLEGLESTRLLIAPRHPERFEMVAELARKKGHTVAKRTAAGTLDESADVLLLNTLGELATAYSLATVAFVGGTLIPHGGQSIMEPALHGRAIVAGPSMDNFPGIIDDFIEVGAIVQIPASISEPDTQRTQLVEAFSDLLLDDARRSGMGMRAASIFEKSTGATERTVKEIALILRDKLRS